MSLVAVVLYNIIMDSIKLVAFDWDQTLWDSWGVHVQAAHHAAKMLGLHEPSKEWIASIFTVPFARHMEMLFPDDTGKATEHYLEFYHSNVKEMAGLFDGVPEMLTELKDRGYQVALLSDKRTVYGANELESSGIAHFFDHVLFLDDGRPYKPDPEGLRLIMEALSTDGGEALYVGDSPVDIQCARKAGATSAGALWGSVNRDAMLKEEPDYVLHRVPEVLTSLAP